MSNRSREVDARFDAYENLQRASSRRSEWCFSRADERLAEEIKWKAPTFVYKGNLASFFPKSTKHVTLMFHTGATLPTPPGSWTATARSQDRSRSATTRPGRQDACAPRTGHRLDRIESLTTVIPGKVVPTGPSANTGRPDMRNRHCLRAARAASAVVLALVSVNCGTDENGAEPNNPPTSASPSPSESRSAEPPSSDAPKATGTTITSAASDYGRVLWGPDRQVVYIWEKEPTATAECYGDCAEAWPPVLTTGEPIATGDVDAALLGTTTRQDGSTQVTYNGHPLYYYAHEGPGEVKCHGVASHGGLWWIVTPAGQRAA